MTTNATTIPLTLNGAPHSAVATTLAELVTALGHDPAAVATAVNGEFVARQKRASTRLAPGDSIEIVSPRQGG